MLIHPLKLEFAKKLCVFFFFFSVAHLSKLAESLWRTDLDMKIEISVHELIFIFFFFFLRVQAGNDLENLPQSFACTDKVATTSIVYFP